MCLELRESEEEYDSASIRQVQRMRLCMNFQDIFKKLAFPLIELRRHAAL